MFCKWCGGDLASSDIKCKRCGREIPALSDCGGFYDLVIVNKDNAINSVPPTSPDRTYRPTNKKLLSNTILLTLILILSIAILFLAIGNYQNNLSMNETNVGIAIQEVEATNGSLNGLSAENDDSIYEEDAVDQSSSQVSNESNLEK